MESAVQREQKDCGGEINYTKLLTLKVQLVKGCTFILSPLIFHLFREVQNKIICQKKDLKRIA
jgi:hypothetical protein